MERHGPGPAFVLTRSVARVGTDNVPHQIPLGVWLAAQEGRQGGSLAIPRLG